ncbi:MAG TPA: hypothetical protein VMJ11_23970 [Paraburkholderia sp.]|uniref:hypothetical protein n=1 Tax=Paraburkholderia sp. TaxID=1926495 RepID=UPI002CA40351|nr:hypothetical protein [Paraburkholderia sp.]HTR09656.1 hypothetical protein [Paraburkholderia sp.]
MGTSTPEKPHLKALDALISADFRLWLPKNFTFDPHFFPILLTKAVPATRFT